MEGKYRVGILRVLQWIIFMIDQIVHAAVGYSIASGWKKEHLKAKSNYESSAHILKIAFRAKTIETECARLENFLLFNTGYTNPSSILSRDNVTLMGVTADQAFFSVLPADVDVYSSELHPFIHVTQSRFATHIIVMPMSSFHLLSNEVGEPTSQIVLVSNTGRCGSTLLAQIFETLPKTIVMSEPGAFILAHNEHCEGRRNDEQEGEILRSILRLQCKAIVGRKIDRMVIKTRARCVQQIKIINASSKYVKHIFMYRHPKNTILSFASAFQFFPPDMMKNILAFGITLPETEQYSSIKSSSMVEGLTFYGFLALSWISKCVCYLEYKHEGIEIYPAKYEDLLKDPQGTISKLLSFLGISKEFVPQALPALQKDSQRGSELGQDMLAKCRIHEFTAEQLREVNFVLRRAGFPSVEEFQDLPDWNELTSPSQLVKAYTSV